MPITETPTPFRIRPLPGMNNKLENYELEDKWVELAQNCRFDIEPGAVDKREPTAYYNSSSVGTGAVTGLYRFYTSAGTAKFIMIHGTKAYVGTDSSGTWTEIRASLTTGKRMSFVPYNDLLYMANGFDNMFIYDGSSDNVTWEAGACKAVLLAGGSNLDESAAYSYKITFDNDAYVTGAVSNTVTTGAAGGNRKVTLSNIPLGPTGTTNRKIYRTEGGGASYKLLATLADNTTTTYVDDIADGTLGAAYPAVTDAIPKGSIIRIHNERLFTTGNPSEPNTVYYSRPYLPHYIKVNTDLDYMNVSPDDGDEIMGIPVHMGQMWCIKKNTIRALNIASASSGADPATWWAGDPISFIGSPAQWSITQTPMGIMFLGWDHWYKFDGSGVEMIIDEFDTSDILESSYNDVVGFYTNGVFLAAYSKKDIATSYHNRIMRYDFRRSALSIDLWISDTISGANCFASKSGDDEGGDVYFGDSVLGYVIREKITDEIYRLSLKSDCDSGTKTNVFVGGTENSPYIELGAEETATNIPNDVIIFWDQVDTNPGTGWVDITATYAGKLIKFGASVTTGGGSSHTHTIAATTPPISSPSTTTGDASRSSLGLPHYTQVTASVGNTTVLPRYANFRIFKSSSCATTEFPDGAIVLWDQATAPTGWQLIGNLDGYYVRVYDEADAWNIATAYVINDLVLYEGVTYICIEANTGNTPSNISAYWREGGNDLGLGYSSSHTHTVSGTLSNGASTTYTDANPGNVYPHYGHTHTYSTVTESADLSSWELDYAGFTMIKKIAESDTWDGVSKYVYAPCLSAPTGWTADTAYNGYFLKCLTGTPTTGAATSGSHTHITDSVTSTIENIYEPGTGTSATTIASHTHVVSFATSSATDPADPAYVQVLLYKYVLGKMKDWNRAITNQYTAGTWTAPSQQINAESLKKIYWNETLIGSDNVLVYTRTGATQVACEAASWSAALTNPNGSDIASTANLWFQYKIVFSATDSRTTNPRVYASDGFVVKYYYSKGATYAETSVYFIYKTGKRHFDSPMNDKSFKKIGILHSGSDGSVTVKWETDNANNSFLVSLYSFPDRWESYFQDTAMGRELDLTIEKNDLYSYKLKEFIGIYTEQPVNI